MRLLTIASGSMLMLMHVLLATIAAAGVSSTSTPVAGPTPTSAQLREVLLEAQQAYDRGIELLPTDPAAAREHFRSATDRFQFVVDSGIENGLVYYNLGNACFQAGELGRAIFNYRMAQRLIAGDPRLDSNLRFARSRVQQPVAASSTREVFSSMFGWHEQVPLRWRFHGLAIVNALLWISLTVWMVRRSGAMRSISLLLSLMWIVLLASLLATMLNLQQRFGVLTSNDVIVRRGNGVGFEPRYDQPLQAGVEFEVLEQRGDWLRIRLPNDEEGWIEASAAVTS